ncbi:SDR family oxidoreductase [Fodinicurvata sp. EGI_FJ10296]|uniref:SDR family oxidoreductase n=1 Tax=Fodinicurvata sp. EGI_FJ10296 TaxID=3231908 RepID=UPI003451A87F
MLNPTAFEGTVVYVAGGTSGINLGIARGFAAHGANVVVSSRSSDKVSAAVETLLADGARAADGFASDVRDYDATAAGIDAAAARHGRFDVVISGAAGNFPATAAGMSANGFKAVVDIDLLGTYNVFRACHRHMTRPGGSMIAVSAPQSTLPMPMQAHVCAAKAGVDMLVRTLAIEWAPEGLRVNAIVPGPIDETEGMNRLAPGAKARAVVEASVPMGRYGTVADIANGALLLSSPLAGYINGAILPVDGGWSLGGAAAAMTTLARAAGPKPGGE